MPEKFKRVCLLPRLAGVGGMVSFQHKLAAGLAARGVEVCYDLRDTPYAAVLVIVWVICLARGRCQQGVRIAAWMG
jgi:hypothetical protein